MKLFIHFLIVLVLLVQFIQVQRASSSNSNPIQLADSCFAVSDYNCAIERYQKLLAEMNGFKNDEEELQLIFNLAESQYMLGDFLNAHKTYQQLQVTAIKYKNQIYLGKAHAGAGHSLWRITNNVGAIQEILKSVEIFNGLKDTSNIIKSSNVLAGIYVSNGNYEDAGLIYDKMLRLAIRANDSINIAANYEYQGIISFYRGNYQQAIEQYKTSLAINDLIGNDFGIAINQSNIGEAYFEMQEYDKALANLLIAKEKQLKFNLNSVLIFTYYTLGKVHSQFQNYDSSFYYYDKSLDLMKFTSEIRDRNEVYRLIADNYAKQGNFRQAYLFHQLHATAKDSLYMSEKNKQLEEIKTRYEVDKRIQENEDLLFQNTEKQKELAAKQDLIQLQYTIGFLIILLLVILSILAYILLNTRRILMTANKTKDKLFGIIAHDLKGPIKNIAVILSLMEKEQQPKLKEQYNQYLNQIVGGLSILTDQLLSWSFSQKGDFNFHLEKHSIRDISDNSIQLFDFQLAEKNIKVMNTISDDLFVLADENALLSVFRNLLSNAVKFTQKGGEIRLEAMKVNNFIEIQIKDNGVGMSESAVQHILEGKHVTSSAGTASERGSGLGFSIVIEFVKKLNGKINLVSKVNKGTTVILKLRKA